MRLVVVVDCLFIVAHVGSWLVGLVGEGVWLVGDEGTSGRVLQHDVADVTDAHHQSIIGACKVEGGRERERGRMKCEQVVHDDEHT